MIHGPHQTAQNIAMRDVGILMNAPQELQGMLAKVHGQQRNKSLAQGILQRDGAHRLDAT